MVRQVNARTVALVQEFEGYRADAYLCPAKVWTVGWGHTGPEVVPGLTCTKRQAEIWLKEDLAIAGNKVRRMIGAVTDELTDNQYGALCSFVFNLGAQPVWTIWKKLKARDFDAVPAQLVRFVNAGGKKLQGLVRRRNAEVELWSLDEPGSEHKSLPSSTTREVETPPAPAEKPNLAKKPAVWAGALAACGTVGEGARQVQALIAPQAAYSDLLTNALGLTAAVVVGASLAAAAITWMQQRKARQ